MNKRITAIQIYTLYTENENEIKMTNKCYAIHYLHGSVPDDKKTIAIFLSETQAQKMMTRLETIVDSFDDYETVDELYNDLYKVHPNSFDDFWSKTDDIHLPIYDLEEYDLITENDEKEIEKNIDFSGMSKEIAKELEFSRADINPVLKSIHPDSGITSDGLSTINAFLHKFICLVITTDIFENATLISKISKNDVRNAMQSFMTPELYKHSVNEGNKAVLKYTDNPNAKSLRIGSGLIFPVNRIHNFLDKYKVNIEASVYFSAVLEYLVAECLEFAGNAARDNRKCRINTRFLQLAIENDEELCVLFGGIIQTCPYIYEKTGYGHVQGSVCGICVKEDSDWCTKHSKLQK